MADSQFPMISLLRRKGTEKWHNIGAKILIMPSLTRETTQNSLTYISLALCTSSLFGFLNAC